MNAETELDKVETVTIDRLIHEIRRQKVILDSDLATLSEPKPERKSIGFTASVGTEGGPKPGVP
jgi:hypothetical protein